MMYRVIIYLAIIALLFSCTVYVPDYKPETGEIEYWINVDADTNKDIGFYLSYDGKQIKACGFSYLKFDSLKRINDVEINIDGFSQDTMHFDIQKFGTMKYIHADGVKYSYAKQMLIDSAAKLKDDTSYFDLTVFKLYNTDVNKLKDELTLSYTIKINGNEKSGKLKFVKYQKEVIQNVRFH